LYKFKLIFTVLNCQRKVIVVNAAASVVVVVNTATTAASASHVTMQLLQVVNLINISKKNYKDTHKRVSVCVAR